MDEAGWLKGVGDDRAGPGGELPGHRPGDRRSGWPPGCGPRASAPRSIPDPIQIGKQMGYGSTRGHKLAVIVGPDEAGAARSSTSATWPPGRRTRGSPGRSWKTRSRARWRSSSRRGRLMSARPPQPSRCAARARRAADRRGARHARLAAATTTPGWPRWRRCCSTGSPGPGYEPMRTPVLEFTELHERKSGAGIVAKLFELAGARARRRSASAPS